MLANKRARWLQPLGPHSTEWDYFQKCIFHPNVHPCNNIISLSPVSIVSSVLTICSAEQQPDRRWRREGKEKLAVVFGLKEADSAEPIICVAFHLPPVLCYRRTLDRWEMIPAGRETQQDVERREGCWQGERIRTQTHESTACKPYMHFDTFPLSIVLCYAFRTIWFTWLIAACEPGYWTQMLTRVQRQRSVVEVYYTQTHSLVVCWAGRGHVEAVQVQYRQKHWLPTKFSIDFVTLLVTYKVLNDYSPWSNSGSLLPY